MAQLDMGNDGQLCGDKSDKMWPSHESIHNISNMMMMAGF